MNFKRYFAFIIGYFCFLSLIEAQKVEITPQQAQLVKVFNPNIDADRFQFTIQNTEAPHPEGNSYRDALAKWKNKLDAVYPKQPHLTPKNIGRINEPLPLPLKKIIPQQGFSTKNPIPGGTPSDNTLAVSNDGYLITSWNSEIYAYDLNADTAMFLPGAFRPAITFASFSPYPTFAPFDPKLLYNPTENKFVIVFISGRTPSDSKIVVGFSTTSNPTDPWNIYELDGAPLNQNTWSDYPAIAMNDNELFLTINLVIVNEPWETGFEQTLIWQMDLDGGFNGASILPSNLISGVSYNGKPLRYMCPVQHGEGPQSNKMHFISNRNYPQLSDSVVLTNDSIFLITLEGDMNNNPTVDVKHIQSPVPYITPPRATQPNGHIFETNDGRVLGGILLENTIHFVASTRSTASGYPIIMHGLIDISDENNLTMDANLIEHEYLELGYPNLAFSGDELHPQDVLIGFNHTADTVFSGYSVVYYNGTTQQYSELVQVMRGKGFVNMHGGTSTERWGDYFGIQRKYDEPGKIYTCGYWGQANTQNSMSVDEIILQNYVMPSVQKASSHEVKSKVYPNPVNNNNPILTFEFELSKQQKVDIFITDIQGKQIKTLLSDVVKKGENRIQISTENIPSGTYLVTIQPEKGNKINEIIVKK